MSDVVTLVEKGKRQTKIVINDSCTLYLSRALTRERPLAEGDPVELSELRQWLQPRQYGEALNAAVRLLATRARSRSELATRLQGMRFDDETIDMALYKLEKENLLDDADFARQWASYRMSQGIGKSRILRELAQKGVEAETAEAACATSDEESAREAAQSVARKLLKRYEGKAEREAVEKTLGGLVRRGYGYSDAKRAISDALQAMRDEA